MIIQYDTTTLKRVSYPGGAVEWHALTNCNGINNFGKFVLNTAMYILYRVKGVEYASYLFEVAGELYTRHGEPIETLTGVWVDTTNQPGTQANSGSLYHEQHGECLTILRQRKLALLTDD